MEQQPRIEKPNKKKPEQAEFIFRPRSDEETRKSIEEKGGVNLTKEERDFLKREQEDREMEENQEDTRSLYVQASRKLPHSAGSRKNKIH